MNRTLTWLVGRVRTCGIVAAFVAGAALAWSAYPADDAARNLPQALRQATGDEEFTSPQTIVQRLSTELGRLAERAEGVSPTELARQAEARKTCTIETLPDPGQKLTAEAIYAKARQSVVVIGGLIKGKKRRYEQLSCATGFVIRPDGVIVTNCHVVEGFQDMKAVGVMTADGRVFPIKATLAADAHNDIAVLKAEAENLLPLPVAASVGVGATVFCLSHPALKTLETETGFYTFTQGIVSGKFRLPLHGHSPLNVLAITADYAKGSSGGPILNDHGAVVGIVCETLSVYDDEDLQDLQMTWKFSRPSGSILALLRAPQAAPKP
jgi:S1-C subfamily serine protease